MKVKSSHNWDMKISSLGLHKSRSASTGTNAFFSILCIFLKFYGQIKKLLSQFSSERSYLASGRNYNFFYHFLLFKMMFVSALALNRAST